MIRDIKIKPVLNGFIVECGCQTLVCEDVDRLTKSINTYLKNPETIETEWINNSINSKFVQSTIGVLRADRPPAEERIYETAPVPSAPRGSGGSCWKSPISPILR
jgi:hypothetical protein